MYSYLCWCIYHESIYSYLCWYCVYICSVVTSEGTEYLIGMVADRDENSRDGGKHLLQYNMYLIFQSQHMYIHV